jgi:predicted Zn-dependent peptidase
MSLLTVLRAAATGAGGDGGDGAKPRFVVPDFDVRETRLANGLLLLTLEDHSAPIVSFQSFFAVGSADERPGVTGAAHFLEHLMFDGGRKYGPKEFDRRLEQAGGSSNAATTLDLTAYHEEFPPAALDLVLDLERDRMEGLALADVAFETELSTVREERRLHSEEDVDGAADELLYATAFLAHPYRWPTVGWMADLERLEKEEIRQFWRDYYRPERCTIVVVGDFETAAVLPKLRAAFSGLQRGTARLPPRTAEPPQRGERRIRLVRTAELPYVVMGWHAPAVRDPIWKALRAAQLVLSGIGSARLDTRLVSESALALNVSAGLDGAVDPGLLEIAVTAAPGHTADEVEQAARAEIEQLGRDGPTEDELVCVRANEAVNVLRDLETVHDRAYALGHAQRYLGDWRAAFTRATLLDDVTAAQVKAAVATLLVAQNLTVVTVVPVAPVGSAGPASTPRCAARAAAAPGFPK